ncbi:GntR family transcriptional regulator [Oceanicella sp. SM1341]|uniref:GntR family transcriptional regulator n=1 Tax=Oceanicella sp. SM1341 TaxID=1548889 RepID=UPI0018E5222B|nr:GntR family transcriptional regulator [Oceanicella sp. SM1341]
MTRLYLRLAEQLRAEFRSGALRDGDAVPSEAQLRQAYGVSRTTVRAALALLEEEKLIERRQGVGAFYRSGRIAKHLARELDFHTEGRAHGQTPATRALSFAARPASLSERTVFGPEARGGVVELRRLRLLNGCASVFQTSVLCHPGLEALARPDFENVSLYRLLERRFGLRVTAMQETLEATTASAEVARILGIEPGAALFNTNRIARDAAGRVVELSHNAVRADRYYFTFEGSIAEFSQ